MVWSKKTAGKIIENIKLAEPSIYISLKEPAFFVAIKRVREDLDKLLLKQLIPEFTKTVQCDKTISFKVYFLSKTGLDTFLKASLKVGYERLPVEEFVLLPRSCFNCYAISNLTVNCKNSALCSKCGSFDHKSTPDSPCLEITFCICS